MSTTKLRLASKVEKRFVVRHALDWYRALIITGLYTVNQNNAFDTRNITSYIPALKACIEAHPFLSATIQELQTENPVFTRPATLDLRNHIQTIDTESSRYKSVDDELELLRKVTLETHDRPWENAETIPPWKIVVLPLPDRADSTQKRVYIIFAYSHAHGDGKSGLAFHRSFLQGLRRQTSDHNESRGFIYKPPSSPLPLPLEEVCNLKISWSFLLSPLLAQYLPHFVCRLLRLHAGGTQLSTDQVYTGDIIRYDRENFHTTSQILVVKADVLADVLKVCRSHGSKLTGLLNQLIVHALSENLAPGTANEFICQFALDLRSLIPAYSDGMTMGNYVSGAYETSPASTNPEYDDAFWGAVRKTTGLLAAAANTLDDQPIGLLKYLGNFRSWFLGHLGKKRDGSFEISNIGVFDPSLPNGSTSSQGWSIERMVFSQPANVTASPLNFQVVTMKGSDMVITLNWQVGALGVVDEDAFAKAVLRHINNGFGKVALGS
ncbi:conserved hypothetical protein [Talaromyces stipitatus ATCC 10500]|uniref:Alcohol acetyltransferase n=1 Tax=Talaromyces stipitatus (strain ATCC 10500 / CBS 375.48 / QM 6759 / NRRL 1006) TaxID=441959 RepID=B8MK89_TALSN|nr:uncharacterized protein TSTA_046960 [Talaromyces stipitatus ATCC 10500]EED15244.1 conserved hypothetical protein [Talaromyces stipitatus ATCC 10500]